MAIDKRTASLGMPWEKEFGYAQAVKVDDTIYLSGQVSHDDKGVIIGPGDMEAQVRQSYVNVKKVLAQYHATMDNIVDETWFVTDIDTAFAVATRCRAEVYSGVPTTANTLVQIQRLAFPELMVEIKCIAKL